MKLNAVHPPIWFAFLAGAAFFALSAADTAAGGKSAKVNMDTYKGIAIGAKFDDLEKKLGPGKRASTKDVPKLTDPDEEKALVNALRAAGSNLLYKWNSGADRLVIGIQTADTGDVVVFKGFFWKDKGEQKGVFAGK